MRLHTFLFLFVMAFLCVPVAQAQTSLGNLDPVTFSFSPELPGPYEQVRIEAKGVGTFLGDAVITWRLNGAVALTGAGERVFTFTTGALGAQSRIDITINSVSKGTITKSFVFIPSVVNLVWEADTSVPPLYRGKALYSGGSNLKVIAFPTVVANGKTISSNNFSFQWTRNGNKLPAQSGLGRDTLTFTGDQLRTLETVSVDVYFDDVLVGRGGVSIPATNPSLVMYQRDPLRGIMYDKAATSPFSLGESEATLVAHPFYFSNSSLAANKVTFTWTINGTPATGPNTAQGIITLRQTGSGAGESRVKVEAQNTDDTSFIQRAETMLRILFNSKQNSVLPGTFSL